MVNVTAKCQQGHSQTTAVDMPLDWAIRWAQLMDGTSPLYQRSPRGDDSSMIGKCGICGTQIDCSVEQVPVPKVEVIFLEDIREYREVFTCECCGKKAYCLDPGDGLPTHLDADEVTELQEEDVL